MSEVKVNKISPRTNCGTTTLGDSGDTFTIPAGVTITNNGTQTGFGRTGTVNWNTTKITADPGPSVSGVGYFTDTSSSAFSVTLPASPSAGDIVAVADYANNWGTNALTLARNGSNIEGAAEDLLCNAGGTSITVVYVGNKGDAKVMLTPWIMAHRFGHAVQAGVRSQKGWSEWREAEEHFFNKVHDLLKQYYGKLPRKDDTFRIKMSLASEYNALFNALGTQKSSRKGIIRRPYEFMYELLAQYIGTGKITLNPFPDEQGYGRKVFGRYVQYLKIKPEYRDTDDRIHASEILANDMEINFNNVLASSVGKIFIM